jgi:hypothetical protein
MDPAGAPEVAAATGRRRAGCDQASDLRALHRMVRARERGALPYRSACDGAAATDRLWTVEDMLNA